MAISLVWLGSGGAGCVAGAVFSHSNGIEESVGTTRNTLPGDGGHRAEVANAETDSEKAVRLFNEGKYSASITLAKVIDEELGVFTDEEKWLILIIRSHMAVGDYESAFKAVDLALQRFPGSLRIRWVGQNVCRYMGANEQADRLMSEIGQLASRSNWRYRDSASQVVLGQYFLALHADAKEVLKAFYEPVKKRNPNDPEVYRAIGQLALDKHDYALAAENFSRVIELLPNDPDAHYRMALSFMPSDPEKANESLTRALAINPQHVESLIIVADEHLSSESYELAQQALTQVLDVNPKHPEAWAYRAVMAHLDNDPKSEGEFRNKALADWQGNPGVDFLIGRELSAKYRFKEGAVYQRRALVYDKHFLPAKIQLAHDLLRLGQELEGWKIADEVFDADQYSVVAHNLVTLRDEMSKFTTLERDGFVVRMASREADIYGPRVLDLLTRAKQTLCSKYDVELEMPVFVEIFPRQQDFAIRTFGLPGGSGFLGVCFGRVITMNSPSAQGANLTSWESILWHEFCHVVTLQKTHNKMPRWLSEGISVYEENLADPAWGEALSVRYREMLLGDAMTPVSELSGAFLHPESPQHLQFAYYESSLVVEFLIERYGARAMRDVLHELSIGTPINDALRRHMAPVEVIDKQFAPFAQSRAESLAAGADWTKPDLPPTATAAEWAKWNAEHPNNLVGLISESGQWLKEQQWESAIKVMLATIELSPTTREIYPMLAKAYRELDEPEKELDALERLAKWEADSVDLFTRILELNAGRGAWEQNKRVARRLLALNPLLASPHRYLAMAAEQTGDDSAIVESLRVLVKLNPLDAADVHFRLASALHRIQDLPLAKRHTLMALEHAPRYRDAHALLLKIVHDQNSETALQEPGLKRTQGDPDKEPK